MNKTVFVMTNAMGNVRQVFANAASMEAVLKQSYRIGQWSEGDQRIPEAPLYGIAGQLPGVAGWVREHQVTDLK